MAKNLDILISSTAFSIFSFSFPLILSVLESMLSIEPNSLISLDAVFSPTPGQPGKLSAASPINASKSITCDVFGILYFSFISFSPNISYPPP